MTSTTGHTCSSPESTISSRYDINNWAYMLQPWINNILSLWHQQLGIHAPALNQQYPLVTTSTTGHTCSNPESTISSHYDTNNWAYMLQPWINNILSLWHQQLGIHAPALNQQYPLIMTSTTGHTCSSPESTISSHYEINNWTYMLQPWINNILSLWHQQLGIHAPALNQQYPLIMTSTTGHTCSSPESTISSHYDINNWTYMLQPWINNILSLWNQQLDIHAPALNQQYPLVTTSTTGHTCSSPESTISSHYDINNWAYMLQPWINDILSIHHQTRSKLSIHQFVCDRVIIEETSLLNAHETCKISTDVTDVNMESIRKVYKVGPTLCCVVMASMRPMKTRCEMSSSHAYENAGAFAGRRMWNVLLKTHVVYWASRVTNLCFSTWILQCD